MARPAWTAQCTDRKLVGELLPVRRRESHKGDYGRVLLLCGSEGLTGAARLAAKAALRAGTCLFCTAKVDLIRPLNHLCHNSNLLRQNGDESGQQCCFLLAAVLMDFENARRYYSSQRNVVRVYTDLTLGGSQLYHGDFSVVETAGRGDNL